MHLFLTDGLHVVQGYSAVVSTGSAVSLGSVKGRESLLNGLDGWYDDTLVLGVLSLCFGWLVACPTMSLVLHYPILVI